MSQEQSIEYVDNFGKKIKIAFMKIINHIKDLVIVFIFFAIWEMLPRIGIIEPSLLPPISKVGHTMFDLVISGALLKHFLISIQRAGLGFILALVISVPLGIALGWNKWFTKFLDPLIQGFRQTAAL
ncbi:MAG: ABC transporter permease, partial [Ruminiclostridium sp.]